MPKPYFYGETSGYKQATELRPKALGKLLARADNVLFIIGSEIGGYPEDILKEIIEKSNATVYKTEASGSDDIEIDYDARYGLMEIVDMLCNGMGDEYDYIVLVGIPYHIETRVLSGLRSYGVRRIVTLNWRHQQYADFSFKNTLKTKDWEKGLKEILDNM